MTNENFGDLRKRLLREERVQQMIRARAYEIYQMRGGQPGGEALDWFQAEGEVLAFLVADEARLGDQKDVEQSVAAVAAPEPYLAARPKNKATTRRPAKSTESSKVAPKKKPAAKRATSKKSPESKPKSKQSGKESGGPKQTFS